VQIAAQIRGVVRAHEKLLEAFGDGERDDRVEYLQAKKKVGEEG
jgi:hypothetical protein